MRIVLLLFLALTAHAQAPQSTADSFVAKMMAFDKNRDGQLTRDEISDERLLTVFEDADANHDNMVAKEELRTYYAKQASANQGRGPGGPRGRGGGPGGFGPPPQTGQIVPGFIRDRLNLTDVQRIQLDVLQREVDAKLGVILTPDQKRQLKQSGPPR